GREDVRALTETVKRTHPVVVEELTPSILSLGQIQKVLQALLDEGVPVRDLVRIFEALSLRAKVSVDHDGLVESARAALGPAIEPLLAQVRDEYGSRVRIISADKVRSGGVGGFFAKQHYELSVEVPDPTEDRNDMARTRKATTEHAQPTLEELVERAEARDRV